MAGRFGGEEKGLSLANLIQYSYRKYAIKDIVDFGYS